MRKLASIQRITAIDPIEGADAIEVASVLGWKVVVKKGEFKVGDLAVYMEIDSVPPDVPEFAFLWKNAEERPNNFRIRTIKLRGQVSQGILFAWRDLLPLMVANTEYWGNGGKGAGREGDDLTELLRVTKYEPPLPAGSSDMEASEFFDGVPKTDEERVQSETGQRHLEALQGRPYYITEKADGASMTVAMHDGKVKVASRNYRLKDLPTSAYWNAARESGLIEFVERNPWLAVQGELVGPGIQKNRLNLSKHTCLVFNVFDRLEGRYYTLSEMRQALYLNEGESIIHGPRMVAVLETGPSFNKTQEELLAFAEGKYQGTQNEREGIVIRSSDGERVSFKAISNRFLLKGGE